MSVAQDLLGSFLAHTLSAAVQYRQFAEIIKAIIIAPDSSLRYTEKRGMRKLLERRDAILRMCKI